MPTLREPEQRHDRKRPATDAFEEEKSSDFGRQERYGRRAGVEPTQAIGLPLQHGNGAQDMSTRLMAHMLGLEVASVETSTQYYPGCQWYPRLAPHTSSPSSSQGDLQVMQYPSSGDFGGDMNTVNSGGMPGSVAVPSSEWSPQTTTPSEYGINNLNYTYDFGQYGV